MDLLILSMMKVQLFLNQIVSDDLFNKMLEALSLNEKKRTEIGNKAFKISENFKYRIISKKTEEFLF